MKILTMCHGGNIRSVGLAWRLKALHGHDAIACGGAANTPETIKFLCDWAEQIIIVDDCIKQYIPEEYNDKLYICPIGPDIYGHCWHPELQKKIESVGVRKL